VAYDDQARILRIELQHVREDAQPQRVLLDVTIHRWQIDVYPYEGRRPQLPAQVDELMLLKAIADHEVNPVADLIWMMKDSLGPDCHKLEFDLGGQPLRGSPKRYPVVVTVSVGLGDRPLPQREGGFMAWFRESTRYMQPCRLNS